MFSFPTPAGLYKQQNQLTLPTKLGYSLMSMSGAVGLHGIIVCWYSRPMMNVWTGSLAIKFISSAKCLKREQTKLAFMGDGSDIAPREPTVNIYVDFGDACHVGQVDVILVGALIKARLQKLRRCHIDRRLERVVGVVRRFFVQITLLRKNKQNIETE